MNNQELQTLIKKLIHSLLHEKGYVCSVDILMGLNILSKKDYEDWRFGRVDYLERVCKTNLNKLSFINDAIKKYSRELQLEKSWTGYNKYGKGVKHQLRFSKSGIKNIEDAYATHYIAKKSPETIKRLN